MVFVDLACALWIFGGFIIGVVVVLFICLFVWWVVWIVGCVCLIVYIDWFRFDLGVFSVEFVLVVDLVVACFVCVFVFYLVLLFVC